MAVLLLGGRKEAVPSPECALPQPQLPAGNEPQEKRELWSLLLGGGDGARPSSLSAKAGTRGHELHAGRLRLFSLIQGRKSPMSPDKSAKLDASVQ